MKKAFSLIELLVSLITISVIVASFAPIITNKLKQDRISLSNASKLSSDCSMFSSGKCEICMKEKGANICISCSLTCPTGQIADIKTCKCKTLTCPSGQYVSGSSCIYCSSSYENCETCTNSSCSTCKSGYKLREGVCKKTTKPKSQEDCNKFSNNNSIYIPYEIKNFNAGGFCLTKKNAGDAGGPDIYFGETILKTLKAGDKSQICPPEIDVRCCWYGHSGRTDKNKIRTAKGNTTDPETGVVTARYCTNNPQDIKVPKNYPKFDYDGCYRTVCNRPAADYICSHYVPGGGTTKIGDWTLASKTDFEALKAIVDAGPASKDDISIDNQLRIQKWSGSSGLQLCQSGGNHDKRGSARCDSASRCHGAFGNSCFPENIWGKDTSVDFTTANSTGYFSIRNTPTFGGYEFFANSVRCVLRETVE